MNKKEDGDSTRHQPEPDRPALPAGSDTAVHIGIGAGATPRRAQPATGSTRYAPRDPSVGRPATDMPPPGHAGALTLDGPGSRNDRAGANPAQDATRPPRQAPDALSGTGKPHGGYAGANRAAPASRTRAGNRPSASNPVPAMDNRNPAGLASGIPMGDAPSLPDAQTPDAGLRTGTAIPQGRATATTGRKGHRAERAGIPALQADKSAAPAGGQLPLPRGAAGDARAMALWLMAGVREGWGLDDMLDSAAVSRTEGADRARARRLATAALRLRGRAEAVLTPLLPRRPRPAIADLLVLATVEMLGFDAPPHGVVSEAVALARRQGPKGVAAAGMVNAVLRRAAEGRAVWDAAKPHQMPAWLRGPVAAAWGASAADAIEVAHEQGAPLDLTAQPAFTAIAGTEALPGGSFRLGAGGQVSALPGFASGDWWVQDAAAALPARLLDPQPRERIADLCAAPGGKTLQLAAAGAVVTAVDISPGRMRRLTENLDRCRLTARLVTADALEWRPDTPPDAILLDAPCTATGTIRRHPELPVIRDGDGIAALVDLQARLLDHALGLLPPGGRLVYATCSLLTAEGEDQIIAALGRHPGLTVQRPDPARLGLEPDWITPEGGIRLRPYYWPERGGMDGFYMARLQTAPASA